MKSFIANKYRVYMAKVANVSCRMVPPMMLVWAREWGSVRMTWLTCNVKKPDELQLRKGVNRA